MTYTGWIKHLKNLLEQEITPIPQQLHQYTAYFNNAFTNGLFWVTLIWLFLHIVFEKLFNNIFRFMKFRLYQRNYLTSALWYCGFYAGSFFYTGYVLFQNGFHPLDSYIKYTVLNETFPRKIDKFTFSFVILLGYFIQSILWGLWKNEERLKIFDRVLILIFMTSANFLRALEFLLNFLLVLAISRLNLELSRIGLIVMKNRQLFRIMVWFQFIIYILLNLAIYLFVIPQYFLNPIISNLVYNGYNFWLFAMITSLMAWYLVDSISSPIFRLVQHFLCHSHEQTSECPGRVLNCGLYQPRNDLAFIMKNIHKEIQRREEHRLMSISLQRNQAGQPILQTIRCVMALKRRIKKQRLRKMNQEQEPE